MYRLSCDSVLSLGLHKTIVLLASVNLRTGSGTERKSVTGGICVLPNNVAGAEWRLYLQRNKVKVPRWARQFFMVEPYRGKVALHKLQHTARSWVYCAAALEKINLHLYFTFPLTKLAAAAVMDVTGAAGVVASGVPPPFFPLLFPMSSDFRPHDLVVFSTDDGEGRRQSKRSHRTQTNF